MKHKNETKREPYQCTQAERTLIGEKQAPKPGDSNYYSPHAIQNRAYEYAERWQVLGKYA